MRLFSLLRENSAGSGGGAGSRSASGGSTQPLLRPRPRLWLLLLLALLALTGLLANLFLLYTSIDQFVALLRQRCKPDEGKNGGAKEGGQQMASGNKQGRVRIGTSGGEVRLFSPASSLGRGKQREETATMGSTIPVTPIHHQKTTTLFVGNTRPPPSSPVPSPPRLRLTAADLLTHQPWTRQRTTPAMTRTTFTWKPPATSTFGISSGQNVPSALVTVVTALLDIGRDRWSQYGRTMQQYHKFMRHLLQLRVPMVVMVDDKSLEFVHRERARIGWGNQTRVRQVSLAQLPLFTFQSQVARIMRSELAANWRPEWDSAMRSHPEASHPEYALLVNSKSFFLAEAAAENPFGTEYFVWLDAGYGHGERSVFPAQWNWRPTFPRGKISLIKLTPPSDSAHRYGLMELYRQDISVFSGGFVAGDRSAVTRLHQLYHRKFLELLQRNKVDDDQTLLVLLYNDHPTLFDISHGDWFDAFELF